MSARLLVVLLLTVVAGGVHSATTSAAADVTCHGERATIIGTNDGDVLRGTPHRDVIAGRGGNDRVTGGAGNDLICGGRGADRLDGGGGDDRLHGGADRIVVTEEQTERVGDVLSGGRGSDLLDPGHDPRPADDVSPDVLSWESAAGPVDIDIGAGTARGAGRDHFAGVDVSVLASSYDDTVVGSVGVDRIFAGPGADRVQGRGGADRIYGDATRHTAHSADVIRGGPGDDELSGMFGRDEVFGGAGDDFLDDFDGDSDSVVGGGGDDHVVGEIVDAGRVQHYRGGRGSDQVDLFTNRINPAAAPANGRWDMATGQVSYQLTTAIEMVAAGFEAGDLNTYGAAWTVEGSATADRLSASGSAGTTFHGLEGDDGFSGSGSDDLFDGGDGTDRSLGMGVGEDTCISVEIFAYDDCEHVLP